MPGAESLKQPQHQTLGPTGQAPRLFTSIEGYHGFVSRLGLLVVGSQVR
jgi:hypothetical protein